jgi:hypothetical protein
MRIETATVVGLPHFPMRAGDRFAARPCENPFLGGVG